MIVRATVGRDILNADVSKIYGALWGETEKNIRALFRNFKFMCALCPNAPILLFNEADGILKERGAGGNSSVSRVEDIVQTIILQELENFEGLFFATTNLADTIDKAYVRRFLFKLELHSPGKAVREKIWRSMIPDLDNEIFPKLAEKYPFSGGQIENIARQKDIFEAVEDRSPGIVELMAFCDAEDSSNEKSRNKIGFMSSKTKRTDY